MKKSDAKKMKELNKKLIRRSFYELHIQTSTELSQKTGLSVVTINALLREMIGDKEVLICADLESNGGRPATKYQYNKYYKCMAVIYGYQKNNKDLITMVITDIFGQCVLRKSTTMENIDEYSFENMLDNAFEKFPMIRIIAFGLPGGEAGGNILYNDYKGIVGNRFMKYYEDKYHVPIRFMNDINAAVNGYSHTKLYPYKNVVGIFFPRLYDPGAGIIINGEIYTGLKGFAGEIGFLPNGVKWKELDYENEEVVLEAVSNIVAILGCIVAPDRIVLYGDFFKKDSGSKLEHRVSTIMNGKYKVQIDISTDLAGDLEYGIICQATHDLLKEEDSME